RVALRDGACRTRRALRRSGLRLQLPQPYVETRALGVGLWTAGCTWRRLDMDAERGEQDRRTALRGLTPPQRTR
ncbi:hypothetical protein DN577_31090, partial [Burkholderia multivorans]